MGVGAFLLTLALLSRFYVYDQLAVAPVDQDSTSTLVGPDATVFDISTMEEITTDLTTTAVTIGDVDAAEDAGGDTVVWVNTSSTEDSDGVVRSRSIDRVAFDAHTGEAVNCCGEYYSSVEGEEEPVEHEGLVFKFPFGTEKKTYDWWDTSLLDTVPIEFEEVEEVEGVETYRFSHTIEPTQVGTIDLPAELLGAEGDEAVTGDRMYSNIRTLWVEPRTGVVIKRQEQQNNTIAYDGVDQITTTEVTTAFTEDDIKANADEYGGLSTQLNLIQNIVPLVGLILGLGLLVVGLVLVLAARRGEAPVDEPAAGAHRGGPGATRVNA
jgi:Porin PorA